MSAVVLLEDVRRGDVHVVGGEAANLGELIHNGFPVPPGFVVTAPAYRSFLTSAGVGREVAALAATAPAELEVTRSAIAVRIHQAPLPTDLESAVVAAWAVLSGRCGPDLVCAVRSSATAEDLESASFAGQHGTYYYVRQSDLLAMIRNCWSSLWSREAVSYRATHGIEHASVHMAVVVQQMVPAEVSGVAFTLNPVTGAADEIVVEASWGMGAGIVDGRVTPDRYVLRRGSYDVKERRIPESGFVSPRRCAATPLTAWCRCRPRSVRPKP